MPIRIIEVVEYDKGERVNGKAMAAFWAIRFERQPDEWLLSPWPKPALGEWRASRKEWKIGPDVAKRISFRLGADVRLWSGVVLPLRIEAVTFGRDDVWGIRPVPMSWESNSQKVREAMVAIANGSYEPPGLPKSDSTTPEREPGEDDEPFDEPPPDAELSVPMEAHD